MELLCLYFFLSFKDHRPYNKVERRIQKMGSFATWWFTFLLHTTAVKGLYISICLELLVLLILPPNLFFPLPILATRSKKIKYTPRSKTRSQSICVLLEMNIPSYNRSVWNKQNHNLLSDHCKKKSDNGLSSSLIQVNI